MIKKYFLQILVVLLLILIAWGLYLVGKVENGKNNPIQASIKQTEGDATPIKLPTAENIDTVFFPVRNWIIPEPEILAKSAIVFNFKQDNSNNVLFKKNAEQVLPIASLTKLMTAIIALENYNPEDIIKISKNSVDINGNNGGLINGEELKVKDLLYIMLVESSNDAAMALAGDGIKIDFDTFIYLMNRKAQEINLKNTYFVEPVGLDSLNQSTASEMAIIAERTLKIPLILEILKTPQTTIFSIDKKFIHNITNTNKLLGKIPQLIGGKTGFTDEAGGCMVTISNISNVSDNYLITVILGSSQREDDTSKLIDWAQKAWIWQ
ncbi:serine hydrolase [Patescibacteria group bacterium]|nr:serine hydrolase [Patescibacteria group bacterium]MBU4458737.1 serine hydrolase [Patescibacteria group bacterium]MCG2696038.1 serine hydrolase [Candidatus Portnoybacteria bacterium]